VPRLRRVTLAGGGEEGRAEGYTVYVQVIGRKKPTQWLSEGKKADDVEGIALPHPILKRNFLAVSGPPKKT